jgi:hypothetical protein
MTVAAVKYRIELRQIEVKGLNARHYFWVKTRVDLDPTKKDPKDREKITVLGELHGFPRDPETGQFRGFSMGGDRLEVYQLLARATSKKVRCYLTSSRSKAARMRSTRDGMSAARWASL